MSKTRILVVSAALGVLGLFASTHLDVEHRNASGLPDFQIRRGTTTTSFQVLIERPGLIVVGSTKCPPCHQLKRWLSARGSTDWEYVALDKATEPQEWLAEPGTLWTYPIPTLVLSRADSRSVLYGWGDDNQSIVRKFLEQS